MNILETYQKISEIVDKTRLNPTNNNKKLAKEEIGNLIEMAKKNDLNLNISTDIIDNIGVFNDFDEQHSYEDSSFDYYEDDESSFNI